MEMGLFLVVFNSALISLHIFIWGTQSLLVEFMFYWIIIDPRFATMLVGLLLKRDFELNKFQTKRYV